MNITSRLQLLVNVDLDVCQNSLASFAILETFEFRPRLQSRVHDPRALVGEENGFSPNLSFRCTATCSMENSMYGSRQLWLDYSQYRFA